MALPTVPYQQSGQWLNETADATAAAPLAALTDSESPSGTEAVSADLLSWLICDTLIAQGQSVMLCTRRVR
jgi:hypothetical protein